MGSCPTAFGTRWHHAGMGGPGESPSAAYRGDARVRQSVDQVRGGGGCGSTDQSGGCRISPGRSRILCTPTGILKCGSAQTRWKHLATQNSGRQALSFTQHGHSSPLPAPIIIELQSLIEALPASGSASVSIESTASAATGCVAHAAVIGARTIATVRSAESMLRSRDKSRYLLMPISALRAAQVKAIYRVNYADFLGASMWRRESPEGQRLAGAG